ncbi:MAG: hypothetical protein VX776_04525, partial [Planctomycetota bacterium]|nr:hypothetical protein [Planctomycetota bacterium]
KSIPCTTRSSFIGSVSTSNLSIQILLRPINLPITTPFWKSQLKDHRFRNCSGDSSYRAE